MESGLLSGLPIIAAAALTGEGAALPADSDG